MGPLNHTFKKYQLQTVNVNIYLEENNISRLGKVSSFMMRL